MKNMPFQYSVLRYIHDFETGEFLNVGFAMFSKEGQYFNVELTKKYKRITDTFPGADGKYIHWYLSRLQTKFDQFKKEFSSSQYDLYSYKSIQEILNSILPIGDSSLQFTQPQGGLTGNPDETFIDRFQRLVEFYFEEDPRPGKKDEKHIWGDYSKYLRKTNVIRHITKRTVSTPNENFEFEYTWKNGKVSIIEPLSFDLVESGTIKNKAHRILGRNFLINNSKDVSHLYYLISAPQSSDKSLQKAYIESKNILGQKFNNYKLELIEEDGFEDFGNFVTDTIQKLYPVEEETEQ